MHTFNRPQGRGSAHTLKPESRGQKVQSQPANLGFKDKSFQAIGSFLPFLFL